MSSEKKHFVSTRLTIRSNTAKGDRQGARAPPKHWCEKLMVPKVLHDVWIVENAYQIKSAEIFIKFDILDYCKGKKIKKILNKDGRI